MNLWKKTTFKKKSISIAHLFFHDRYDKETILILTLKTFSISNGPGKLSFLDLYYKETKLDPTLKPLSMGLNHSNRIVFFLFDNVYLIAVPL